MGPIFRVCVRSEKGRYDVYLVLITYPILEVPFASLGPIFRTSAVRYRVGVGISCLEIIKGSGAEGRPSL